MARILRALVLMAVVTFITEPSFAQHSAIKPNPRYAYRSQVYLLSSRFPIDDITGVTVENFRGKHKLSSKELSFLKQQLKLARAFGGLEVKPGHIVVHIQLKSNSKVKLGYTYASTGSIHFERGGANGADFSGTFFLPVDLNFDNY